MSNPWDNDPVVSSAATATAPAPWEKDAVLAPAPAAAPRAITAAPSPAPWERDAIVTPAAPAAPAAPPPPAAPVYDAATNLPADGSLIGNTVRQTGSDFANAGSAIKAQAQKLAAAAGQQYVQQNAVTPEEFAARQYQPPTSLLDEWGGGSFAAMPATPEQKAQATDAAQATRDEAANREAAALEKINAPVVRAAAPAVLPVGATLAAAATGAPMLAPVVGGSIANAEAFDATDRELRAKGVPAEQARESAGLAAAGAGAAAGAAAGMAPKPGTGPIARMVFSGAVGGSQDLAAQLSTELASGRPVDWKQVGASAAFGVVFDAGMQALHQVYRGRTVPAEQVEQLQKAKTPQDVEEVVAGARQSTDPIVEPAPAGEPVNQLPPEAARDPIITPAPQPEGAPNEAAETRIGPEIPQSDEQAVGPAGGNRPGSPRGVDRTQEIRGEENGGAVEGRQEEGQAEGQRQPEPPQPVAQPDVRRADELTPPAQAESNDVTNTVTSGVQEPPAQAAPAVPEKPAGANAESTPPPAPVEPPGRQSLRTKLQERIDAGQQVTTAQLKRFEGEPWADEVLAQRTPRKPTSPDALSVRRGELQNQLRDLVVRENGPGISDLSSDHPLAMQVMRGEQTPGKLISLDTAIAEAEKLPDDHPARVVLHNLRELDKNPRGTKVQSVNTNDVQDGTRVVVNDGETFTIDKENGMVEDGVRGQIPEGGMTLLGKKVLPPAEHPQSSEPFLTPESSAPAREIIPNPNQESPKGLFGQAVTEPAGIGEQNPLFHEPNAAPPVPRETVGSAEANNPANTVAMFPGGPTRSPAPEAPKPGETVAAAAWRDPEGRVFAGPTHVDALEQAGLDMMTDPRLYDDNIPEEQHPLRGWTDGFVTSKGRFVDREEAARIAKANQSVEPSLIDGGRFLSAHEMPEGWEEQADAATSRPPPPPPQPPNIGDTVTALSRGGQPVSGVVKYVAGRFAQVDQGDGMKILVRRDTMKPFGPANEGPSIGPGETLLGGTLIPTSTKAVNSKAADADPAPVATSGGVGQALRDRFQSLADSARRISGQTLPSLSRQSPEAAQHLARHVAARVYAQEAGPIIAREIVGAEPGGELDTRIGAMLAEENLMDIPGHTASLIGAEGSPIQTHADLVQTARDPRTQEVLDRYNDWFQREAEPNFKASQGIAPTEDLPTRGSLTGTRVNLKPVFADEAPSPTTVYAGGQGNLNNPRLRPSPFARKAKGTGDAYDISLSAMIENTIAKGTAIADLHRAYDSMIKDGLAVVGKPGQRPVLNGKPTKPLEIQSALRFANRNAEGDVSTFTRPANTLYVRSDVYPEVRQALGVDQPLRIPIVTSAANVANKVALAGTTEALYHVRNQVSALVRSPGAGFVVDRMVRKAGQLVSDDPEVRQQIVRLAREGAWRAPGEPLKGWQRFNPLAGLSKLVEKTDRVARLVMDDAYTNLVNRGLVKDTPEGRRDWVNQLGQYQRRLQEPFVAAARDTGIAPFATAGTNFWAMRLRNLVLDPRAPATSPVANLKLRTMMLGRLAVIPAAAAAVNYLRWGKMQPGGVPIGAIKTGEDERGRSRYVDPMDWTGERGGLRASGIGAVAQGVREGRTAGQTTDQAVTDVATSALSPFEGPIVQNAAVGLTGKSPAGFQVAKRAGRGESQAAENVKAMARTANPIGAALTSEGPGSSIGGPFRVKTGQSESAATREARRLAAERSQGIQLTDEERQRHDARRQLVKSIRENPQQTGKLLQEAVAAGRIPASERAEVVRESHRTDLENLVHGMEAEDAMRVFGVATPEERKALAPLLREKITRNRTARPEQHQAWLKAVNQAA